MSERPSTFGYADLVRMAMFSALIAVLGLIPKFDLPFAPGVPITAQTLGVMLAGLILGSRTGLLSVVLFLFVVAMGAPVLAGGRGGLGVFFGPTVGFLVGWVFGAWSVGAVFSLLRGGFRKEKIFVSALISCWIGGIAVVYFFGILGLSYRGNLTLGQAALASLIFLPGDLLKSFIAAWIVSRLGAYGHHP